MDEIFGACSKAVGLITAMDPSLREIVWLSLRVSLTAVAAAALIGLPLGAVLALAQFPGNKLIVILINALMGLPPVVVGLTVYLLLSRSGPFGEFGWLFTPAAMVIAQCILVTPIICALTRQTIEDLWVEYQEQLRSLGATTSRALLTLLWEGRFTLLTGVLAGFGRAIGEVGAVIIVGGNILHVTRVMTTAIALETARGSLELALALGIILITLALIVNAAVYCTKAITLRFAG